MARNMQLYQQIADVVRQEIRDGQYDTSLPSEKSLCDRFQVGSGTIKTALALLAREGIITRIPGKGTFVRDSTPASTLVMAENTPNATIGVVLPQMQSAMITHLLAAILAVSERENVQPLLALSHSDSQRESALIEEFIQRGAQGLLIWPCDGEQYNETLLRHHLDGYPVVLVDRWLPGIDIPCVRTDHAAGARKAMEFLSKAGHKRVAFLSVGSENPHYTQSIQERLSGYRQSCQQYQLEVSSDLEWVHSREEGESIAQHVDWIAQRFETVPDVTAVMAVETYDLECVRQFSQQYGRDIPDNLSVVGFDGGEITLDRARGVVSYFASKEWTWIDQHFSLMGDQAVQALINSIRNDTPADSIIIPCELKVGGSVGPPHRLFHEEDVSQGDTKGPPEGDTARLTSDAR